ncbi:MAG TPA: DNA internalization-related competence protein ComEC/Rec2, partial [Dehalococcoidia bacterium]|nr:DNA internalization-related competence protein ComEC/Rec2 [Dehalococcoidia bacterium]
QAELQLTAQRIIPQCTVCKVAHHGSATSTTAWFLDVASPQIAVISAEPDIYGHPHPDVLGRLGEKIGTGNIYRTDKDGTIEFFTDGDRLWMKIG